MSTHYAAKPRRVKREPYPEVPQDHFARQYPNQARRASSSREAEDALIDSVLSKYAGSLESAPREDARNLVREYIRGDWFALAALGDLLQDNGLTFDDDLVQASYGQAGKPLEAMLRDPEQGGTSYRSGRTRRREADPIRRLEQDRETREDRKAPISEPSFNLIQDALSNRPQTLPDEYVNETLKRPLPFKKAPRRARYGAMVASSSNTEENLTFEEAYSRSQTGDQKVFKQIADQMLAQVGLKGTSHSAVGDWEDGAEHSILTQIPDQADMDTLRYVGAWQGLTGNQRAVLVFRPDHKGLDSVYEIKVPETDANKIRAQLSRHGIKYRTIVPGRQGARVIIYDQKRELRDQVTQFAGSYNADVREAVGSGEYVGASTRAAARAEYRKIIAEFEARTGRAQTGGQVHQDQAVQPRRGGSPQAQGVA